MGIPLRERLGAVVGILRAGRRLKGWQGVRGMTDAKIALTHGSKFPYDAPDKWWDTDGLNPPPAKDWAHYAARGAIADLQDRGGLKHGFSNIDEDTRVEIVRAIAAIITEAARGIMS